MFRICVSRPFSPSPSTPVGVRARYRYVLSAFRSSSPLPPPGHGDDPGFDTRRKKQRLFLRVRSNVFVSVFYLRTFVFIHFLCVFFLFNLPSHKTSFSRSSRAVHVRHARITIFEPRGERARKTALCNCVRPVENAVRPPTGDNSRTSSVVAREGRSSRSGRRQSRAAARHVPIVAVLATPVVGRFRWLVSVFPARSETTRRQRPRT